MAELEMTNSTSSSLKSSLSMFQTHSALKLISLELLPVFIGKASEVLVMFLSFELSLSCVPGTTLTDLVSVFALIEMFQFRIPQSLWELCQQSLAKCTILEDIEEGRQVLFGTLMSACVHCILMLIIFYPVALVMGKMLYISKEVRTQLYLIIAMGNFLYTFSIGFQNIFQVECRFLLVLSLRTITAICGALLMLLCVLSRTNYTSTVFIELCEYASLFLSMMWLAFWNRGHSILNIANKTVIAVSTESFDVLKSQLREIVKRILKQLGIACANFLEYLNTPLMIFISIVTVNKFSDREIADKMAVQAEFYAFYIFGSLFKVITFAVQQILVFDLSVLLKQRKYGKIVRLELLALLYVCVINTAVLLLIIFSDVLLYFTGGNVQLQNYFLENESNCNKTMLLAYGIGSLQFFEDFENISFIYNHQYVRVLVVGICKIAAGMISIFRGYKLEFENVDMVQSYIFSEAVGILSGIFTFCYQIVSTVIEGAIENRKEALLKK